MLQPLLTEEQKELIAAERRLLGALREQLARLDLPPEQLAALAASIEQLDELFLLVIVGEFNAGKSAFVNALLGEPLLEEGVTPTTSRIHLVRFGTERSRSTTAAGIEVIEAPVELLREINLVDTPGTNAIDREHEALTRDYVPRSDLVLFVTSADRPFTESERAFLEQLREWGKKIVVVINKVDILERAEQSETVAAFVRDGCQTMLGFAPELFCVSAKRALVGDPTGSGFAELERYVAEQLDRSERLRLKLSNPLGVGRRVAREASDRVAARAELLSEDFQTLSDLDGQLDQYRKDLAREFELRLADVDRLLHQVEIRGDDFFEDTLRLTRLPDLLNKARLEQQFERRVIADLPQKIDTQVGELIDWLLESELRQWRAVAATVERRRHEHGDRIVGELGGGLEASRRSLLESLGQSAQGAVDHYDRRREGSRLAESVQRAVAGAALLEVGAVGLGSIVAAAATSTAVDITGILAAGALAALGLFVIPARRRRAKRELAHRLTVLRERLMGGLRSEFDRELERSAARLAEAVGPYTRFVRAERERLHAAAAELDECAAEIARLEQRVVSVV